MATTKLGVLCLLFFFLLFFSFKNKNLSHQIYSTEKSFFSWLKNCTNNNKKNERTRPRWWWCWWWWNQSYGSVKGNDGSRGKHLKTSCWYLIYVTNIALEAKHINWVYQDMNLRRRLKACRERKGEKERDAWKIEWEREKERMEQYSINK